ncbi:MAG: thioredoxin [candidate division Zixibacteria bacterium]|nr:thioredoxin [candidate division Zixibacteria bacterium]
MGFFKNLFNKPPKPGKPRPITDETFEQEVLASNIPAVVDFWSRRCPPCQVMGGLLDEIGPNYAGRINIFKLNVDENQRTAIQYRVQSIPTVILFRKGKPVDRIVGLMPLNPLRKKLDSLVQ